MLGNQCDRAQMLSALKKQSSMHCEKVSSHEVFQNYFLFKVFKKTFRKTKKLHCSTQLFRLVIILWNILFSRVFGITMKKHPNKFFDSRKTKVNFEILTRHILDNSIYFKHFTKKSIFNLMPVMSTRPIM